MVHVAVAREAMKRADLKADVGAIPEDQVFSGSGLDSLDIYDVIHEMQEPTVKEVADEDIEKLQTITYVVSFFS